MDGYKYRVDFYKSAWFGNAWHWQWRLVSRNGTILARSNNLFSTKKGCMRGFMELMGGISWCNYEFSDGKGWLYDLTDDA